MCFYIDYIHAITVCSLGTFIRSLYVHTSEVFSLVTSTQPRRVFTLITFTPLDYAHLVPSHDLCMFTGYVHATLVFSLVISTQPRCVFTLIAFTPLQYAHLLASHDLSMFTGYVHTTLVLSLVVVVTQTQCLLFLSSQTLVCSFVIFM